MISGFLKLRLKYEDYEVLMVDINRRSYKKEQVAVCKSFQNNILNLFCLRYGLSYDSVSWRKIKEKKNKKDQKQANLCDDVDDGYLTGDERNKRAEDRGGPLC